MKFVQYVLTLALSLAFVVYANAAAPFAKVGSATTAGRHQQDQRQPKEVTEIAGTIERWVDGDTCDFISDNTGKRIHVRLWLVDAPEADQPGGALATEYVRNHPEIGTGKRVILGMVGEDQHDRPLGQLKGENAKNYTTEELLASGYFWPFSPALRTDIKKDYADHLMKVFTDTVAAQKGIFKYNDPVETKRATDHLKGSYSIDLYGLDPSAVPPYLWRKMSVEERDSIRAEYERKALGLEHSAPMPSGRSH